MIYAAFFCFCIFFAISWRSLARARKHDSVLFPFLQLQHDVMHFLLHNTDSITRDEYVAVRGLLQALEHAVRNYNQNKKTIFNLRKVVKMLRDYRHTLKQADIPEPVDNAEIKKFHTRFVGCFAQAFLAYTPLIRSEIVLRFAVFMFGTRAGRQLLRNEMRKRYVLETADTVRCDARNIDLSGAAA